MGEADPRNDPSTVSQDSTGKRQENTCVVGSNPAARTNSLPFMEKSEQRINLPATMTPSWLAADMVALAQVEEDHTVLEPSAGTGSLIKACCYGKITAIELNKGLFNGLPKFLIHNALNVDFLTYDFGETTFNRVIMNPPHKRCVEHVAKAASLLDEDDGRLVVLVHAVYVAEIETFLQNVRKYSLPRETFMVDDKYIESTIIVWDKEN